jgi:hypothetical protein
VYFLLTLKLENKKVEQVLPGSREGWEGGGREVAQTIYIHVSKCTNNKIKTKYIGHSFL